MAARRVSKASFGMGLVGSEIREDVTLRVPVEMLRRSIVGLGWTGEGRSSLDGCCCCGGCGLGSSSFWGCGCC